MSWLAKRTPRLKGMGLPLMEFAAWSYSENFPVSETLKKKPPLSKRERTGDFEQAVKTADKDSFIYFDPPYHSPDKTNFTGYQADGFGEEEQERLRNVMIKITDRGSKCLLSNSDTEYIRKIYNYDFFEIISVQAKRHINSDSAGRGSVNEVLIKNWKG
ncbi:MAG: DNA adenine methylase [Treponema sp.]|nr:DNA adenine methylase [Treponema sp.]